MDKIQRLKDDATLFLLAYELGDGKDLNLVRHSVDSLRQAEKLEESLRDAEREN